MYTAEEQKLLRFLGLETFDETVPCLHSVLELSTGDLVKPTDYYSSWLASRWEILGLVRLLEELRTPKPSQCIYEAPREPQSPQPMEQPELEKLMRQWEGKNTVLIAGSPAFNEGANMVEGGNGRWQCVRSFVSIDGEKKQVRSLRYNKDWTEADNQRISVIERIPFAGRYIFYLAGPQEAGTALAIVHLRCALERFLDTSTANDIDDVTSILCDYINCSASEPQFALVFSSEVSETFLEGRPHAKIMPSNPMVLDALPPSA